MRTNTLFIESSLYRHRCLKYLYIFRYCTLPLWEHVIVPWESAPHRTGGHDSADSSSHAPSAWEAREAYGTSCTLPLVSAAKQIQCYDNINFIIAESLDKQGVYSSERQKSCVWWFKCSESKNHWSIIFSPIYYYSHTLQHFNVTITHFHLSHGKARDVAKIFP